MKKKIKIAFLMICTMILIVPSYAYGEDSNNDAKITKIVGEYIFFGNYPQREVVAQASDSGTYGKPWEDASDYLIDECLYNKLIHAVWDTSGNTTLDGRKYCRLKKSDVPASSTASSCFRWADADTYHYFIYDPIKWKVLERNGDEATLLSDIVLDIKHYKVTESKDTWENCYLRGWANSTFIEDAFSDKEQEAINITNVKNENNTKYGTDGGKDTNDKIFLLAESDVSGVGAIKYGLNTCATRQACSSTYAKALGIQSGTVENKGKCYWYLRTPGSNDDEISEVTSGGDVSLEGISALAYFDGVRPALHLNVKSSDCYSNEIVTKEINTEDVTLSDSTFEYNGKAKKPKIAIVNLEEGIDYTLTYLNNKNPGTATVIITGIGKCSGTITKTFSITVPKQTGGLTRDVNYDCVYFGSYPQKEVVYDAEDSGVYGKTWSTTDDYYIVHADLYTKLMRANWDNNGDATVDGDKYHRIKKSDATYSTSSNSNYYTWSDDNTYHYFKYEPIKWRVLERDGNDAFLLSDIALDDQMYNSSSSYVTWETCTLRAWLNSTFLNRAFTAAEQDAIKTTTVENKDNINYGADGGNDTQDKVYLLSESEVYTESAVKYGFDSSYSAYDKARQTKSSTYAKAMGIYTKDYDSYLGNCGYWWLRSPGCRGRYAACVDENGDVNRAGGSVNYDISGIHPALHLNLQCLNPEDAGKTSSIKTMSISDIEIPSDKYVYRHSAVTPKVTVPGLTEGQDYEVAYSDNNAIGIATATVTGKGDWSGTITKKFAIVDEIDISEMTLSIPKTTYYYSGEAVCPKVTIEGLEEGTDFDVTYEDNDGVGVAKITATGKDGYVGSITKNFLIYACENHTYGDWKVTKAASCIEKGSREKECSVCHSKITEDIPMTAHNPEETAAKAATCTKDGNSEYYYCSGCKKYYSDKGCTDEIAENSWVKSALGHSWNDGEVTKEPTCTEKGVKTFECTRAGCSETKTEEIAAKGHSWNDDFTTDTPATCTEKGSKSKHCKNCTEKTDVTEILALGHVWDSGEVTKEPAETEKGERTYHCARSGCNETKKEVIAALGAVNNAVTNIAGSLSDNPTNQQKAEAVSDFQQIGASGIAYSLEEGAAGSIATQMKAIEEKTGTAAVVNDNTQVKGVSIIGGGLNAKAENDTVASVSLKIDSVEESKKAEVLSAVPEGVKTDNAVVMSMSLDGAQTDKDDNLLVPVLISFDVPDGIDADDMVVVHKSSKGVELLSVILSEDKKTASIVVKHFSDFVISQTESSSGGGGATGGGGGGGAAPAETEYTVTFNCQGHGSAVQSQKVKENEKVTKPADPKAEGYVFGGWFTDKTCTSEWNFTRDTVTKDITLYAKWTEEANSIKECQITLNPEEFGYTGKVQKPAVTVMTSAGKAMAEGTDYTLSFVNSKNIGAYEVTVTGAGKYKDSAKAAYKINPSSKTVKGIKSVKPGKKKLTVTWTKASKTYLKQVSGYQISYATDKSFETAKAKTVSVKSTSKTITGLKAKQKYYVKMRSYKTVKGEKYYSTWSKVKTGKTK